MYQLTVPPQGRSSTRDPMRNSMPAASLSTMSENTESVSILGYNQLISRTNLGLGSAVSVLIFIAVILIAFVFVRLFNVRMAEGRPGT